MLSLLAAVCALRASPSLRRPTALSLRMAVDADTTGSGAVESTTEVLQETVGTDVASRTAQEMADIMAAKDIVRRSVSRPAAERKKILRELQVKWHPDRQYGDASSREFAAELITMVNEAANVARRQIATTETKRKRGQAYDVLQRQLQSQDVEALRTAIEDARNVEVSGSEVIRAEEVLARLEGASSRIKQQQGSAGALGNAIKALQAIFGAVAVTSCAFVLMGSQSAEKLAASRAAAANVAVERAAVETLAAESAEIKALQRVTAAKAAAEQAAAEQAAAVSAETLVAERLAAARTAAKQAAEEQAAADAAVKAVAGRKAASSSS